MADFTALFTEVVLNTNVYIDTILYFLWSFIWIRVVVIAPLLFLMIIRLTNRLMGRNVH